MSAGALILVSGATGYIASRLIPQLLTRGYQVRAMARQPQRLMNKGWYSQTEVVHGDVMDPASLAPAMQGVHTAYYLIHNMSSGHGYTELEIEGAKNFARAAQQAGVRHIIYLGGLADPEQHIAPHMRSRIETGAALRDGAVPVTEFRAGVVAGSGSISFEMIRFMTELFPVIPAPFWVRNRSQPISTRNVIDYLLAALDNHTGQGRVFEIGGPEVTTYRELMLAYARARGLKRGFFLLPYVPVWFMAFGIGLTTPVPRPIAYALVGGLSSDSVVMHPDALETFPEVQLINFESAAREALTQLHPQRIERIWDDRDGRTKVLMHEGFFIDHREMPLETTPAKMIRAVTESAALGTVESTGENHVLMRLKMRMPGSGWVEWKKGRHSNYLSQTVFFTPHGIGGFLFWYLLRPVWILAFKQLLKSIARKSVVQ